MLITYIMDRFVYHLIVVKQHHAPITKIHCWSSYMRLQAVRRILLPVAMMSWWTKELHIHNPLFWYLKYALKVLGALINNSKVWPDSFVRTSDEQRCYLYYVDWMLDISIGPLNSLAVHSTIIIVDVFSLICCVSAGARLVS